jgi:hypothetical protein
MGWVVNATPQLLSIGKVIRYPLHMKLGGPQGQSGRVSSENPFPLRGSNLELSGRSESLYRLIYPGPRLF